MESSLKKAKVSVQLPAPDLPQLAYTRSGIPFNPSENIWHWIDGVFRIRLDFLRLNLPETVPVISLKYTLHVFVKLNAPTYAMNLYNAFVHFLGLREGLPPLVTIDVNEVSIYRSRLGEHEKWRLGHLNVLLQKWEALGLVGVDPECTKYLRERRKPGNRKGVAVRQRDPVDGPFTEEEYISLYKAVDAAYGTGEISRWVAVLTRLLFACGGRISQYASLKATDLKVDGGTFVLSLPQVKTGLEHSRASFLTFILSPQTGRLVKEHIDRHRVDGFGDEAALFLENEVLKSGPRKRLRSDTDPFLGHCTRDSLSSAFKRTLSTISLPSARLNFDQMPVNPKRFRSTFGTRLAEEGASKAEIADRLGHADLQNVDVYFEASPIVVENIDRAIGKQLAPLALAFRGRLIDGEHQSTCKGAPGSRIIDFRASTKPLASCAGKGYGCGLNKPIACYTCFRFEPWLDGPHEEVLARLERERDEWADDSRMAAINDATITAIKEVIAECTHVREQRAAEGDS